MAAELPIKNFCGVRRFSFPLPFLPSESEALCEERKKNEGSVMCEGWLELRRRNGKLKKSKISQSIDQQQQAGEQVDWIFEFILVNFDPFPLFFVVGWQLLCRAHALAVLLLVNYSVLLCNVYILASKLD